MKSAVDVVACKQFVIHAENPLHNCLLGNEEKKVPRIFSLGNI